MNALVPYLAALHQQDLLEQAELRPRATLSQGTEPESLRGTLASGPTAVASAEGEMEVFAVMDDGQLWNRYWDRTYWHAWESLGGELDPASTPASSSSGADRLDVYARGRNDKT